MEREQMTPNALGDYITAHQAKTKRLEKIVLTLLQQRKDEGGTVFVKRICDMASGKALAATLRDGVIL